MTKTTKTAVFALLATVAILVTVVSAEAQNTVDEPELITTITVVNQNTDLHAVASAGLFITHSALSPDGSKLVLAQGTTVVVYDTETGKKLYTVDISVPTIGPRPQNDINDNRHVRYVMFSPDGETMTAMADSKAVIKADIKDVGYMDVAHVTVSYITLIDVKTGEKKEQFAAPKGKNKNTQPYEHLKDYMQDTDIQLVANMQNYIRHIQYLADGNRLVISEYGDDGLGRMLIYDVDAKEIVREWDPQPSWVPEWVPEKENKPHLMNMDISSDGRYVAMLYSLYSTQDFFSRYITQVMEVETGKTIFSEKTKDFILDVQFLLGGKYLKVNSAYGIRIMEMPSGKEVWRTTNTSGAGWEWYPSIDGTLLYGVLRYGASDGGDCVVVDAATGKPLYTLKESPFPRGINKRNFSKFHISNDGRRIATVAWDKIQIYEFPTQKRLLELGANQLEEQETAVSTGDNEIKPFKKIKGAFSDFAMSPDNKIIVATPSDLLDNRPGMTIDPSDERVSRPYTVWDVETGKEITQFRCETMRRFPTIIIFTPDGKEVIVVGNDTGDIIFLDTTTWQPTRKIPGKGTDNPIRSLKLSPDGKTLFVARMNSSALYDVKTLSKLLDFDKTENVGFPSSSTFTPDSETFIISDRDSLEFYSIAARKQTKKLRIGYYAMALHCVPGDQHLYCFSVDLSAAYDHGLRIFDRKTGDVLMLPKFMDKHSLPKFSPNGRYYISDKMKENTLKRTFYDIKAGEPIGTIPIIAETTRPASDTGHGRFSPDERFYLWYFADEISIYPMP